MFPLTIIPPIWKMIAGYCSFDSGQQLRVTSKQLALIVAREEGEDLKRRYPSSLLPLSLSNTDILWMFGADKAGFRSKENFTQFCKMCDPVNPVPKITGLLPHNFEFKNGKVVFTTSYSPLNGGNTSCYVHYFGVTGERQLVLKLRDWFQKNCEWAEICHGSRDFG